MKLVRLLCLVSLSLLLASPTLGSERRSRRPRRPAAPKLAAGALGMPAVTTPSGLTYVITRRGAGQKPTVGETVLVHYTGMLTSGKKFDSSYDRNEPIAFPLGAGRVIKGWDEGIAELGVGDQAILVIPPELAYGDRDVGNGVIPPKSTLIFVVELVDVKRSSVSEIVGRVLDEKGVDAAVGAFRAMQANGFGEVYASEGELNAVGYSLLGRHRVKDAIEILKLNVEAYPDSANVYDSLGEAYAADGATALAIESYQHSLLLDPTNANAAAMLKKLKGE